MKSSVEQQSATRVKITVEVPFDELKPEFDKAHEALSQQVQIPGFRKGKVPAPIIDQRIGRDQVLSQAVSESIDEHYRAGVAESGIKPLGRPSADIAEWPDAKDFSGDLELTIEVDVRPEIELPPLDKLTVIVDPIEVADADVATQLDELRGRFGTLSTVERPAKTGLSSSSGSSSTRPVVTTSRRAFLSQAVQWESYRSSITSLETSRAFAPSEISSTTKPWIRGTLWIK